MNRIAFFVLGIFLVLLINVVYQILLLGPSKVANATLRSNYSIDSKIESKFSAEASSHTRGRAPLPFPIFEEQHMLPPRTSTSTLIYLSYPRNQSVNLFTQGLNKSDVKFCTQDGFKSRVLDTKEFRFYGECCVMIVDCEWSSSWQHGKIVSVGKDAHIFPSTAYLHLELLSKMSGPKYRICAMTQVRDASKFIPDWIRYHRRIGIDHFYIFDNNSTEIYAEDPDAEFIRFPWKKSQFQALTYGAQMVQSRCQWLAVFDVDEYIYPRGAGSVPALIAGSNASDVGELVLKILLMSSADLSRCPNASVPEGYVLRPNQTEELLAPKCISWAEGLDGHRIHAGVFRKGHNKSRRIVVPGESGHIVHYKLQCWPDYYVSKYKHGRSGLVRDWADPGYQQHAAPEGWERRGRENTVGDTSFRDYFLEVVARPRPEPVLVN